MSDISDAMGGAFNPQEHEASSGFDPIPAGWYPVMIETAVVKPTKDGTGKQLALTVVIVDGDYKNRKIFTGINIANKNPEAVKIAQRELAAIGQAFGLAAIQDSAELLNQPLMAKISVKKDEGYEPSNAIKRWKAIGETAAPAAAPNQTAAAPAAKAPTASGKPAMPWMKK